MNSIPFNIVLVEPEIPPNTGNIARLCGATETNLHLVGKLGFSIDDKSLKRAGLDYWDCVRIFRWDSLDELLKEHPEARFVCTSKRAEKPYHLFKFERGDYILFGKETKGLPEKLLEEHRDTSIRIPMSGPVRSINLSTAAGIVLYEALRQSGMLG